MAAPEKVQVLPEFFPNPADDALPVELPSSVPPKNPDTLIKSLFLGGVASIGILAGFGSAVSMAKKRDPTSFDKGILAGAERLESGGTLALRALGWGTVWAVGGVGLLCMAVYKLLDVHSAQDFRRKMTAAMPRVPKKAPNPDERTEFASIREFFEYISQEKKSK